MKDGNVSIHLNMFTFRCICAGLLLLSLCDVGRCEQVEIARDGISTSVIVVAAEASASEKHAAEELADFLEQVTGSRFDIVDRYDSKKSSLLVGEKAAKFADKDFSVDRLGKEELILRTVGKDLILAGGRPRGTLYAVYTFLEETIGCRWWSSKASTIPKMANIKIGPLDVQDGPAFEYRQPYWTDAFDGDWAARNKCNGGHAQLDKKRGGKIVYDGFVHTFYQSYPHFISPEKYFEKHPEWFSQLDGKRKHENGQLCLTNEEMRKELVKNLRNMLIDHRHKGQVIVSVSQNDWAGMCECDPCRAAVEKGESESAPLISFVNAVANDIVGEFPNVAISTLAYEWSQKPPKGIRVNDHVIIRLATTGCSFSHPFTHEKNKQFRERIEAWGEISNRIYIWDYVTNFAHYVSPYPNLRTLGPNAKFFADNRVKGVFSQGAYGNSQGAEMAELRAWVTAKLFWDPSRNGQELIDEFLRGYYGAAGEHIGAYLDVIHNAIEESDGTLDMYDAPVGDKFLTIKTMSKAMEHFRAGEKAVAGNKELSKRVQVAKMPVMYVFLMRWDELKESAQSEGIDWPVSENIKDVFNEFNKIKKENGTVALSEGGARDSWPMIEERIKLEGKVVPVPSGCESISRTKWGELQDFGFFLKGGAEIVEDELASDGSAAQMASDRDGAAVVRQLWRVPIAHLAAAEGKRLRLKVSVRCSVIGNAGDAFKCWVDGKKNQRVIRANEITDGRYHTYDIGAYEKINRWKHLNVAAVKNPNNVKGVWLDRAWLIIEE